jgi:hydrogenase maturation factor
MCLGSIQVLENAWDEGGARLGRLEGGALVSLSFLPDAEAGTYVLVHMGIPVEVLDPETAREALALREGELS